jgi:group I intron endonuclease
VSTGEKEQAGTREAIIEKIFKSAQKVYKNLHQVETQVLIRKENSRKAGIYILFNIFNNKFYVGSAITNRINTRFRNHCFHGTGSSATKRAISHHGLVNFYFIIYEYFPGLILKENFSTEHFKLLARESAAINDLKPDYNIRKILKIAPNSPVGSTNPSHTVETVEKMGRRETTWDDAQITEALSEARSEAPAVVRILDNPVRRNQKKS